MRDLGGLPTQDGGQIQPGRLVRSDNLQELTDADIETLLEHGVTDIVDLRSKAELQMTGPGPLIDLESLTHHHHSLFADDDIAVEDALVLPWADRVEEERDDNHWTSHYLGYLAERPDSVSDALRVVARAEGAAVVHCAAGKDRTGTVVALALSAVGVSDEDVTADYLATTERIEGIVERLQATPAYADNLRDRPMSDHIPDPETIPRLLDAVRRTAGSVPAFLKATGWSDEDLEQLRRRLTDPAG
ncbi:protein tyrosine phosphatase [Luteipulveratus mongoliensis]|uniref:Protein tyrosine phosphatase n=2 Tax=Luteipulveratus mongoliensis TaxID=571913 RepID=A0A0K1JPK7_9MICO|nr:protein tyrosine phosphatase [Luteipulveratus mongoliensis]